MGECVKGWEKFNVGAVLFVLVALLIGASFYHKGDLTQLGLFGDFFGGLANAAALLLIAYGVRLQQKEQQINLKHLNDQSRALLDSSQEQMFLTLYGKLEKILNEISYYPYNKVNKETIFGIPALRAIIPNYGSYVRQTGNLGPSLKVFLFSYIQTLSYLSSFQDNYKKEQYQKMIFQELAELVTQLLSHEKSGPRLSIPDAWFNEIALLHNDWHKDK